MRLRMEAKKKWCERKPYFSVLDVYSDNLIGNCVKDKKNKCENDETLLLLLVKIQEFTTSSVNRKIRQCRKSFTIFLSVKYKRRRSSKTVRKI